MSEELQDLDLMDLMESLFGTSAGLFSVSLPSRSGALRGAAHPDELETAMARTPATPKAVYRARPIKRTRRTKAEMQTIREALYTTLAADHPATVRQVFYRLVANGVIPKTENEYKGTVGRLLVQMRKSEDIPYGWIADNTRWMRKGNSYSSVESALQAAAQGYRRALWAEQDVYVEVWCEKDALAGVVMEETNPWDVPLMVSRGFSSVTYLYDTAQSLLSRHKPCHIYLLTDYDLAGENIAGQIERGLREHAPQADIRIQRIAVTAEQIAIMNLPTRPAKKTDVERGWKGGECVDLDAIPPHLLRKLVREAIEQHVDWQAYKVTLLAEREERAWLQRLTLDGPRAA